MRDYTELPQANPFDALHWPETVPWIVCAGAYLEPTLIVWAKSDHYEDVFELFVEWADENAPGLLTSFDDDDYREAAAGAPGRVTQPPGCTAALTAASFASTSFRSATVRSGPGSIVPTIYPARSQNDADTFCKCSGRCL